MPHNTLRSIVFAILIGLGTTVLCGCKSQLHQKIPVLTFTVAQHAVLDLSMGKDRLADTLTKYFGTTRSEGKKIVDYAADHNSRDVLANDASLAVEKSMTELEKEDPVASRKEFVVQVMAPFLQFELHNNPLPESERNRIFDRYAAAYSIGAAPNGLRMIAASIHSYQAGGSFHADSLNFFNQQIVPYGHLLQINNRYKQACLLDAVDTILPPIKWRDSTLWILEVGRSIPCFLGNEYGYTTLNSQFVVVVEDRIRQQANEIHRRLDTSWHETGYPDRRLAERVWRSVGLQMSRDEADRSSLALLRRDFVGRSEPEIEILLEQETAIHEAKHRADDADLPTMILNSDCEVSAHLTQAICSGSPFYSLVEAIGRVEGFYFSSGDPVLGALLARLWNIAGHAQNLSFSPEALRTELTGAYSDFVTKSSRSHLPPLDKFQNSLVPQIKDGVRRSRTSVRQR